MLQLPVGMRRSLGITESNMRYLVRHRVLLPLTIIVEKWTSTRAYPATTRLALRVFYAFFSLSFAKTVFYLDEFSGFNV